MLAPPDTGDTWLGLSPDPLPSTEVAEWVVLPDCGAVVQFSGTARDHSTDRPGVDLLQYEAYEDQVEPRLDAIVAEMRRRWDDLGRVALLHRVGPVAVGDPAVVVAVSSPHRDAAFEAARFAIDTLKTTVPIWKRERWQGGESWGREAQHIIEMLPDTAIPGSVVPEAAIPGSVVPRAAIPDSVVPEAAIPGSVVPEAAIPGSVVPEAAIPGTAIPEAAR